MACYSGSYGILTGLPKSSDCQDGLREESVAETGAFEKGLETLPVFMYVCMHMYINIDVNIYLCICICIYMYIYTHIHVYMYIYVRYTCMYDMYV